LRLLGDRLEDPAGWSDVVSIPSSIDLPATESLGECLVLCEDAHSS